MEFLYVRRSASYKNTFYSYVLRFIDMKFSLAVKFLDWTIHSAMHTYQKMGNKAEITDEHKLRYYDTLETFYFPYHIM